MHLLLPGRHHILTNFQVEYLENVINSDLSRLKDVNNEELGLEGKIDSMIWAVTSSNHSNTRRNPLPANRREVAIEDFSTQLDAESFVYMIDDLRETPDFADYVGKIIEVQSDGRFELTPENTVVACSTPQVIEMYEQLGFKVLPIELADRADEKYSARRPWDLVNVIVQAGKEGRDWRKDEIYLEEVSQASRKILEKYNYGGSIIELHNDPLLGDDGDITETRDYNVYSRAFDEGAARKYEIIKNYIKPGRIVDIGCCTGSLIEMICREDTFRESDFYGIEASRDLHERCLQRKFNKEFGNDNVFFHRRNITRGSIFNPDSVDTTIVASLDHEIESYQGREALEDIFSQIYEQTAPGGVFIDLDVIGPENKDEIVYMRLNKDDGRNIDYMKKFGKKQRKEFMEYLEGMSTSARFMRFAMDFRHEEGYRMEYGIENIEGVDYARLRMQDACEFMSKKDYLDNWESEMHETFCFWSSSEKRSALEKAGFNILPGSGDFRNEWIVDNRCRGKAEMYRKTEKGMEQMPYPVTNALMVCQK